MFLCLAPLVHVAVAMKSLLIVASLVAGLAGQDQAEPKLDLRPLLQRVSEEIHWQPDYEAAAAAAKKSGRPLLVVVNRLRGFAIPDAMRLHVFADPDVSRLVRERFVAMRYAPEQEAPFRDHAVYGMGPSTLGAAMLVVSPDGRVLHQTHTTNPFAAYDFLVSALPRVNAKDEPPLAIAENLRRKRRGEQALAVVEQAKARLANDAGADEASPVDVTELVLHLRMGEPKRAHECAKRLAARHQKGMSPEIAYWVGVSAFVCGDKASGRKVLESLVQHVPHNEWTARLAIACARVYDDSHFGKLDMSWPPEEAIASFRNVELAETSNDLVRVEQNAVDYLLAAQREDGSWISPSEITIRVRHHPFTIAVSALAGRSMLQRSEDQRCRQASERAIAFVLAQQQLLEQQPLPMRFMDYSVWSDAMALLFLSDCLAAEVGDQQQVRSGMELALARLSTKQRASGGFSYFLTMDPDNASAPPPEAMSFTTAAVANAMLRARAVGIDVDEQRLEQALDAVERARGDNGAFAYSVGNGRGGAKVDGAAGRGPLCELVLYRAGRATLADVRRALRLFQQHRASFARELGKSLMHAGPDGQGCHYLFFDYATAAEAAATLPAAQCGEHAQWLIETILRSRSVEGGFRDTSINGWPFGTAMALTVLHDLRTR